MPEQTADGQPDDTTGLPERAAHAERSAEKGHAAASPARPRCPHCQLPHDLDPDSGVPAVCASIRARLAEAERRHAAGDHGGCARINCDVLRARAEAEARQDEAAAVSAIPPADNTPLRERIATALARTTLKPPYLHCLVMADAVLAELPPPADRGAVLHGAVVALERHLENFFREWPDERQSSPWVHGWTDAMAELRHLAAEAQQQGGTTADKAAALGLTDTEYRARSHEAAVAAVRAAIPGMYAAVGFRLEDVINETAEAQRAEEAAAAGTDACAEG